MSDRLAGAKSARSAAGISGRVTGGNNDSGGPEDEDGPADQLRSESGDGAGAQGGSGSGDGAGDQGGSELGEGRVRRSRRHRSQNWPETGAPHLGQASPAPAVAPGPPTRFALIVRTWPEAGLPTIRSPQKSQKSSLVEL